MMNPKIASKIPWPIAPPPQLKVKCVLCHDDAENICQSCKEWLVKAIKDSPDLKKHLLVFKKLDKI